MVLEEGDDDAATLWTTLYQEESHDGETTCVPCVYEETMTPDAVTALLPVLGYAIVSIFTPGPNNITSSSLGMRVGYGRTLRFIAGVVTGFFVVMTLAGLLTEALVAAVQRAEVFLRVLGVAYLLWLAWMVIRPHQSEATFGAGTRFVDGFLLQFVNVKVILFGITMYAALLTPWGHCLVRRVLLERR